MKIRKITSLVAALAFVVMVLTSFVLYIVPQGRIAYWAGWKFLGLSKTQWGDIHINTGILFLLALVLHTYYNRRSSGFHTQRIRQNDVKTILQPI